LLEKKRQERENGRSRVAAAHRRRHRDDKDRAERLREMQEDAEARDRNLHDKMNQKRDYEENHQQRRGGSFLKDLARETHGLASGDDLASRIARNRHTNQHPSDAKFL